MHSVYLPLAAGGGAGDFRKFSVRGGLGNFWSAGGGYPFRCGLQNLGGAEDFDKFCKNVKEKFSKIK